MKLLSPLKEQNQDIEVQYERVKPQTTNISEEYLTSVGKRDYQKQYVIFIKQHFDFNFFKSIMSTVLT